MKKNILIIGHKGYIGTILSEQINKNFRNKINIIGVDFNLFSLNKYFKKKNKFKNLFALLKKNSDLIYYPSFFSRKRLILENLKFNLLFDFKKFVRLILNILFNKDLNLETKWIKDEITKKFYIKYFCNTAGTIIDDFWLDLNKDTKFII